MIFREKLYLREKHGKRLTAEFSTRLTASQRATKTNANKKANRLPAAVGHGFNGDPASADNRRID